MNTFCIFTYVKIALPYWYLFEQKHIALYAYIDILIREKTTAPPWWLEKKSIISLGATEFENTFRHQFSFLRST